MIIDRDSLKNISGCDFYDGSLIHTRFAYKFFRERVARIGNIITFRSPMEVTANLVDLEDSLNEDYIYSDDAINFCMEIPDIDLFGGICFQRLFNSHLATLLADQYLKRPVSVDGDDIMIPIEGSEPKKASVSIAKKTNDAVLIHTGINIKAGNRAPNFAFSTELSDEQAQEFMKKGCEIFYTLAHDIFVSSTKVV